MPTPIDSRLGRYRSWLRREPVDRPMIGLSWEPDVYLIPELMGEDARGQSVLAGSIHPEAVASYVEQCYRQALELETDLIQPFLAGFGVPWVEAIAGCPIVAGPGSLWAEEFLDDYAARWPVHLDAENPWLRKLIEFTRLLVNLSGGRFPVSLPLTRGPLDVLAAMRGANRMCFDLADRPDEVAAILDELTDLWIGINKAVLALIPSFHGGYVTRMKMWAPGSAVTPQNDISSTISPAMYHRFALPCDERIVTSFPYHSFHLHSTEYHQIDELLTLDRLTAIQIFLDTGDSGVSIDRVLDAVRRAQMKKPVLVGAMDVATAERCLRELPSAGLCLMLSTTPYGAIPEEHKAWLRARCTTA
jgi:hypothetical protein